MIFGAKVRRSIFCPRRSVLAEPETAIAGNVIVRVGRENEPAGVDVNGNSLDGSWAQTEHVVLHPEEAIEYALRLRLAVPLPRVFVGDHDHRERAVFYGPTAIAEAEDYIAQNVGAGGGKWSLDVSDDRCDNCGAIFAGDARQRAFEGWVCPVCFDDPRPDGWLSPIEARGKKNG